MVSDADLIELGGYWAYQDLLVDTTITVNETNYLIIDIQYDMNPQAMTVVNSSGDAIIVFQGTQVKDGDMQDILTDIQLGVGQLNEQFNGVLAYNNHIEIKLKEYEKKYGVTYDINYVAGNSLGGALANYLAVMLEGDSLVSVTLDPAPLPANLAINTMNVRNYVANTSPLYLACINAGFKEGINFPGKFVFVEYGIFSFLDLASNHTGYLKQEMLTSGIGVDDFIPFSIWNSEFVLGTQQNLTTRIKINKENLFLLNQTMKTKMESIRLNILKYLDPTYELIRDQKEKIFERHFDLVEAFMNEFSQVFLITGNSVQQLKNIMVILSNIGEGGFTVPDYDINDIKQSCLKIVKQIFVDKEKGYNDGFVERLEKHHHVIDENLHIIMDKWNYVIEAANIIYTTFTSLDDNVAQSIESGQSFLKFDTNTISKPTKKLLVSQEFMVVKSVTKQRQLQIDNSYHEFSLKVTIILENLIIFISNLLKKARKQVDIVREIKLTEYKIQRLSWETIITGATTEYYKEAYEKQWDDKENSYNNIFQELERITLLINEMELEVKGFQGKIPTILLGFKPYITQLVFLGTKFGEVQRNVHATISLARNAALVFDEIWNRIEENEAICIIQLKEVSKEIAKDLTILIKQMEIITIG